MTHRMHTVLWRLLVVVLCALCHVATQTTIQTQEPMMIAWVRARTGGALHFDWSVMSAWTDENSLDDIAGFQIFVNDQHVDSINATTFHYDLFGLDSNTTYAFHVNATLASSNVTALWSDTVIATTTDLTSPGIMDVPVLLDIGGGFVQVAVKPPRDAGGAELVNMTVIVRSLVDFSMISLSLPAITRNYTAYGLNALTTYQVSAYATNAANLSAAESLHLTITTLSLQLPGTCPPPIVIGVTGASVKLQLQPPLDDGGARIQGYNVYMFSNESGSFEEVSTTASDPAIVEILRLPGSGDRPLLSETLYMFKAVAINLADICISIPTTLEFAGLLSVRTGVAALPSAPPSPYFLSATGGQISINLVPPTNMNGSVLRGFFIKINGSVNELVDADDAVVHNIYALTAASSYVIEVSADTNFGQTLWSEPIIMNTTAPTNPTAPRNVQVFNVSTSRATITWSSPLDTGGAEITGYTVLLIALGKKEKRATPHAMLTLTNLVAKTVYTVRVTVVNSVGRESTYVANQRVTFTTLLALAPSEPWGITSISATGGSIEVGWNAPIETGGTRLDTLLYNATMFSVASCFRSDPSNPCSDCNYAKQPGTEEYLPLYSSADCERPETCPDGTSNCCVTRQSEKLGMGLECAQMNLMRRYRVVVGTNTTTFVGLNYSAIYYFGVVASNAIGRSNLSNIVGLQTANQTAPGLPIRFVESEVSGGSVQFSWEHPLDTGGSTIIGYRIYRDFEILVDELVSPPFKDCGNLLASTEYIYGVSAVDAFLQEGAMATIVIKTLAVSLPSPPSMLLNGSTSTWLNISIVPSCDNGGTAAPSYQYMLQQGGNTIRFSYFSCCNLMLDALQPNQSYVVAVRVLNTAGSHPWVEQLYKTTSGVPSTPIITLRQANSLSVVLAVEPTVPYDREITSYETRISVGDNFLAQTIMGCTTITIMRPTLCRITELQPATLYTFNVRANGRLGSSPWTSGQYRTCNESSGVFEMLSPVYSTTRGDISVTVRRINGTAGSAIVGVNISQPDNVFLWCDCLIAVGCNCTMHLVVLGNVSQPGSLTFIDGQETQVISISTSDSDAVALEPLSAILTLVGNASLLSSQISTLLRMDRSQYVGFASFTRSRKEVYENSTFAKVNIVRLDGSNGSITFDVETFDMTAAAYKHYVPMTKSITLVDHQTSASIWIRLIDDNFYEGERSFGLRLTGPSQVNRAQSLITRTIIILDDEDVSKQLPGKPTDVRIVRITGGEIEIEWDTPIGQAQVRGYLVRVASLNANNFVSLYNLTDTTFTLSPLAPDTAYSMELAAWNLFGLGDFSEALNISTTTPSPPDPPLHFHPRYIGSSSIELVWEHSLDTGGSSLAGYMLWMEFDSGRKVDLGFVDASELSFYVQNLNASTTYVFYIAAATVSYPVFSSNEYSTVVVNTTKGTIPQPSPRITLLKPSTGGTLSIAVQEPDDTGGLPIIDYALYLRKAVDTGTEGAEDNGAAFNLVCNNASLKVDDTERTCTVYLLLADTSYEVYATISNSMGTSLPGPLAIFTTASLAIPSPPLNFDATIVTAGNIYLQWDLPLDLGGAADVVGYVVFQRRNLYSDDSFIVYDGQNSTEKSVWIKGLVRNSAYAFFVVALNVASFCVNPGARNASQDLVISTLAYSPLDPPGTPFVISQTGGSISIGWTVPDDLAGIPLNGYQVLLLNSDGSESQTPISELVSPFITTFTHYGLNESTAYHYTIVAVNADGRSDRSTTISAMTTPCSAPGYVQRLHSVETTGGRIALAWDPPLDTGGREIVSYQIRRTDLSDLVTVWVPSFNDSRGLTSYSWYVYEIKAYNGLLMGAPNFIGFTTTQPTPPGTPKLQSLIPFGGKIQASWVAPEDNGGIPITGYIVALLNQNRSLVNSEYRTSQSAHVFWGLLANTEYFFTIKATNDAGESAVATWPVTTTPIDLPGTPAQPVVVDIHGGSVTILVDTSTYTGGDDSMVMTLRMEDGTTHTLESNTTRVTLYGLIALTNYAFWVEVQNSVGVMLSPELAVTTGNISTPSVVENMELVSASFDQLSLKWNTPEDTGGDIALQYQLSYFRCDSSGNQLDSGLVYIAASNTALLTSLQASSTYGIRVVAVTTTGLSGPSTSTHIFTTERYDQGYVIAEQAEVTIFESAPVVLIPLQRVNGTFGNASFSFVTINGSALSGVNYEYLSGTQTMMTNVKTSYIEVRILNDAVYRTNISFVVIITDLTESVESQTRVIVLDDSNEGFVSFATSSLSFLESAGVVSVPILRVGGTSFVTVIAPYAINIQSALDKFEILDSNLTFTEGETVVDLHLQIYNDSEYQYIPDSITIGFTVLQSGARHGDNATMNIIALDDGDISLPKACTNLQLLATTGGSMQLKWTPPLDKGGANVVLTYVVEYKIDGVLSLSRSVSVENCTVYGLNASTAYRVSVSAANSVGIGSPSVSSLLATAPASPATSVQNIQLLSASGSQLLLSWDAPIDNGGSPIVSYNVYHVLSSGNLETFTSVSFIGSRLCYISGLSALTQYAIQIQTLTALISAGELSPTAVFETTYPDVPDLPPAAMITWKSAGAMTVMMYNPANVGGSAIQSYHLFLMAAGDSEFTMVYNGPLRVFTEYKLKRRTNYSIKYRVINSIGSSNFSASIDVATLDKSLPSNPTNVTLVNVTGGASTLKWDEPLDTGGRDITGYSVVIARANDVEVGTIGYDGKQSVMREGTVYGLTANTSYDMYVVAFTDISNCYDAAEWNRSSIVSLSTLEPAAPPMPPSLYQEQITGGIVELLWTEPRDTGGIPISGYNLYLVSPTGSHLLIFSTNNSRVRSFTHSNLTELTTYSYVIFANNHVGQSPLSAILNCRTTSASSPSAPLNVQQLPYRTGGAIQIGWDRPVDTGGLPFQGYWIYRDGMIIAQDLTPDTRSYIDKAGLLSSRSYAYTIRALSTSSMGSVLSEVCNAITSSATKPQAPYLVNASANASYINAKWMSDLDTGGISILLYDVRLILSSSVIKNYTGQSTSYSFMGLSAQTTYTLLVVTANDVGRSDPLQVNVTTKSATAPGVPDAPLVVSVFGGNFTVEVTTPLDTGGIAITSMTVYEKRTGSVSIINIASSKYTKYTFFGVSRESDYEVSCSATNARGESAQSIAVTVRTTPINLPGQILSAPTIVATTGTSTALRWAAPIDTGGDQNLTYYVQLVDSNGTVFTYPSITNETTITRLNYNSSYVVSVRATNKAGNGSWSPSMAVKTQPDAAGEFNLLSNSLAVLENGTKIELPVVRNNGLSGNITISYSAVVSASTATIGSDYALVLGSSITTGSIAFKDQQAQVSIVVYILDDTIYEHPDEQFLIQLTSASGTGKLGANTIARVTILDDNDAGYVGFEKSSYEVSESAQAAVIPIIREYGSSGRITLGFTYIDGTATVDRDYRKTTSTIIMENGVTRVELRVPIINDRIFEYPDEDFSIIMQIVSGGGILRIRTTHVTILDDGDMSEPGNCPPPIILSTTGGAAFVELGLPTHNGSSTGALPNYILELTSPVSTIELKKPTAKYVMVGQLTALTTYTLSVAANNSVGSGAFSYAVTFSTTNPSLPGEITSLAIGSRTGGSLTLTWLPPDDTGGVSITKYRIYLVDSFGRKEVVASTLQNTLEATIYGFRASTEYNFSAQAGNAVSVPELANGWGAYSALFTFSTASITLPSPSLTHQGYYKPPTGGEITLSWEEPKDTGGADISGYHIYARTSSTPFFLALNASNNTNTFGTATTLYAETTYILFVLAQNGLPYTDLPGFFTVIGGSSVIQTTVDLRKVIGNGSVIAIQDYTFVVGNISKPVKGMLPLTFAHSSASLINQRGRLLGQVKYFAALNTTKATLPAIPPPPILVNASGGMINVTLHSPLDTGGIPIIDFKVYWNGKELSTDNYLTYPESDKLQITTLVSILNLEPLTDYVISSVAVNSLSLCYFGRDITSDKVIVRTTNISVPGPPQLVTSSRTGGGITLSLVDPLDKGGHIIEWYRVYYTQDGTEQPWKLGYNGSVHRAEIAGLKPLTKYAFLGSVDNGVYESENCSQWIAKTLAVSSPGAPASPTLVKATGGMLKIAWDYPHDNGGLQVTRFQVTKASGVDGSGKSTTIVASLSSSFYKLEAESEYEFVIRAINGIGVGSGSVPITYMTTQGTAPVGDVKVTVNRITGGATLISFNEPEDLGGVSSESMIYQVLVNNENSVNLTFDAEDTGSASALQTGGRRLTEVVHRRLASSSSPSIVVGGLDSETMYDVQVQPINKFFSGPLSELSTVTTTNATTPTEPLDLTCYKATGGSITVKWDEPIDTGGLPIDTYTLFMAQSTAGPYDVACVDATTFCTVNGLTPDTVYLYYIIATNAVGDSPQSSVITISTLSASAPGPPENVLITSVSHDTVECMWSEPADNGGEAILTYNVTIVGEDGQTSPLPVITSRTSASISSLIPSTWYSVFVTANNTNGGVGEASFSRYFVTSHSANIPAQPRIGCVSQSTIFLYWDPYPDATQYQLFRIATDMQSVYNGSSAFFTDTVIPGEEYAYAVSAKISGVFGAISTSVPVNFSNATRETFCSGDTGFIEELNYLPNTNKRWNISPTIPYSQITLNFIKFDLECDHDYVEIREIDTDALVWKGGCLRTGTFIIQAPTSITIRFVSDSSISKSGFSLHYQADGMNKLTHIPSPGGERICSKHGRGQVDGSCKCNIGFTGEDCSNYIVCCTNQKKCFHPVCDATNVIAVYGELGNDTTGTGEMMNTSEKGTAAKAVQSLAKALELSLDGGTIFIYPGVYKGAANCGLNIHSKSITIMTLKGPYWTNINCNHADAAFRDVKNASLSISGLTLKNCASSAGGAINILNGSLVIQNARVLNTNATVGGAIYGVSTNITLSQVSFSKCSAGINGGAIYLADSVLKMNQSNITESTSDDGGALLLCGRTIVSGIETEFVANSASTSGGAVSVNGDVEINGLRIRANSAPYGGGIALKAGTLRVENTAISANIASNSGGGIALIEDTIIDAINTVLAENVATTAGGGIFVEGVATISFSSDSALKNNTAEHGGGMYISDSSVDIRGLVIYDGNGHQSGGGVAIVGSTVMWSDMKIRSNVAQDGGGVMVIDSKIFNLGFVVISENTADYGGGIMLNKSTLAGNETLVQSNVANKTGGGVFVSLDSTLANVTVETCSAEAGGGGYFTDVDVSLLDVVFSNCSARYNGGGIMAVNSQINNTNVNISESFATDGGGIYVVSSSIIGDIRVNTCQATESAGGIYLLTDALLLGVSVINSNATRGGGLFSSTGSFHITDTQFESSVASQEGGGIYANHSEITLTNVEIRSHTSMLKGGGLFASQSNLVFCNASVHSCSAKDGGGVFLSSSVVRTINESDPTQIIDNYASVSGGNVYITGSSTILNMCIANGTSVDGAGIKISDGNCRIERCFVMQNRATSAGGGVNADNNSVIFLADTLIASNEAENYGGGIHIEDSNILHANISVVENAASQGGGLFVRGNAELIKESADGPRALFDHNQVHISEDELGDGSAIYLDAGSMLNASDLDLLYGNASHGGSIYMDASVLYLSDCQIAYSHATSGGGVYLSDQSELNMFNCVLESNTASQVGGSLASNGQSDSPPNVITLMDCIIANNSADVYGGAIMVSFTELSGSRNVVKENIVTRGSGGAIASMSYGSIDMIHWEIYNNTVGTATFVQGGALYLAGGTVVSITDSTLLSNAEADLVRYGGLIFVQGPLTTLTINNSRLGFGQAYSGSAIYAMDTTVLISNCTLDNGYSYEFGGAIFSHNSRLDIYDTYIYNNFAYYDGGGIFMRSGGELQIENSIFKLNAVQDSGGALYIAPAGSIQCNISRTIMTENTNFGFGSAIFVGRNNILQLEHSEIIYNGGDSTEGGALYAVDATIYVEDTLFEFNSAYRGGAIELSRSASLSANRTIIRNNSALVWGGALYASVRAIATLDNCTFEHNHAVEGGAMYAIGSTSFSMQNIQSRSNIAANLGGAIAIKGGANFVIDDSEFSSNEGYTGGAIVVTEYAAISLTNIQFSKNKANDFGGAIYIDTETHTADNKILCVMSRFGDNEAMGGSDIYWIYNPWYVFNCLNCVSLSAMSDAISIMTSAADIAGGWWPTTVTSGVSLESSKDQSLNETASSSASMEASGDGDGSISNPAYSKLWPTILVRDFYGVIASHDNQTQCRAAVANNEIDSFEFYPSTTILVENGYVTFADAEILAESRLKPYLLNVSCTLSTDVSRAFAINITVENCNPGYQNQDGICIPCKKGTYSLDGARCYLCPLGATCEQTDSSGIETGVSIPTRTEGYFLWDSRSSYMTSMCDDPSSWSDDDPCKNVGITDLTYRIHKCSRMATFGKFWGRKRIFACLSRNEYYSCDTRQACVEDSTVDVASFNKEIQCNAGYGGVMCASCLKNYYKVASGMCKPCSDPNDPSVAKTPRLLAMIPLGLAILAVVLICFYFSNASENEIVKLAKAAKKFQVYDVNARRKSIIMAAKFYVQERARSMMRRIHKRMRRKRKLFLFGIAPRTTPMPSFRAEKFKILLGFFQIFGGYKKVYEVTWPNEMSRLMDAFSIAEFSFVDTTGMECFFERDYFTSYRLLLFGILGMLLLTALLLVWGTVRYRAILSTLPRHCVECGLPVFKLMHQYKSQALLRRTTMASMLKTQQKKKDDRDHTRSFVTRMQVSASSRAGSVLKRFNTWWLETWVGRILSRLVSLTRLPASSSHHHPSCPTTQKIASEVLAMVVRSNLRLWRARIRLRLNYQSYQNKCIKLLFWILLLFYPELSQRVIGMFYCDEIGKQFYMTRDKSLLCYEGAWIYYLPLTIVLLVVWVIGVPFLFWIIIFVKRRYGIEEKLLLLEDPSNTQAKRRLLIDMRQDIIDQGEQVDEEKLQLFEKELLAEFMRNKRLNVRANASILEPTMIAQVGFIYHSYKPQFWWYEVWDLGRKLCLNCVISLLTKTGANRIIAGLIILLVYLTVMLFYQPYKERSDSALAGVTQIQLFITLFCGLLFKMGSLYLEPKVVSLLIYVAFFSNIITIAYAVFSIVYEKVDATRKARRRIREDHRRAIQEHVRKLWQRAYGYAFTEIYLRDTSIRPMPIQVILELTRRNKLEKETDAIQKQVEHTAFADNDHGINGSITSPSHIAMNANHPRPK